MSWPPDRRTAVLIWSLLMLALTVRVVGQPGRNSVYPIFTEAGQHWRAGETVYSFEEPEPGLDYFRYSPLVAAGFVPWSCLPASLGEILWRVLNLSVFLAGFACFLRAVYPSEGGLKEGAPVWLSLLLIPLTLPSLNNGQTNLLVIGFLLLALAAAARERWSLAALALTPPILLKLYPLALALLLLLYAPGKLGWRLLLCLLVAVLLPFALQEPGYVAQQYGLWFESLGGDNRRTWAFAKGYRDFYLLLRLAGLPLSALPYLALQLGAAATIGGIVVWGRWKAWRRSELLRAILDLGCSWMILFGPATESSTYALLAPTLALAAWQAVQPGRSAWTRGALIAIVALFLGSVVITALPGGKQLAFFLNPLAALLLFGERLGNLSYVSVTDTRRHVPSAV